MYKHLFTSKKHLLEEIIRVDHAGELGAKYIYLGQLMALKEDRDILEMLEGELKHLEFFEEEIKIHGYAPSIFNPIWQKMAFLMGFLSGIMGRKTAMLCTYSVEEVIEKHYLKQINSLPFCDLHATLERFRKEELEHSQIGSSQSEGYKKYSKVFTFITHLGIFLSSKV
jgi:ubiquinone biosynthesis monooxygenase Coq7